MDEGVVLNEFPMYEQSDIKICIRRRFFAMFSAKTQCSTEDDSMSKYKIQLLDPRISFL